MLSEVLYQDPSNYLGVLLFQLIITILLYCIIPLLFAKFRKNPITSRKYRFLCFVGNFFVMCLFIAISGSSTGTPYFLWTWVFSSVGIKNLKSNGILVSVSDIKAAKKASSEITSPVQSASTHPDEFVIALNVCRKCQKEIPSDSTYCPYCGKKVPTQKKPMKWHKILLIAILILLIVLTSTFSIFFIINYQNGIIAMDNQQFIAAKWHFDKIPYSADLFPEESAYISAGALMESGEYLQAYEALGNLNTPYPASIKEELTRKLYTQAQDYYRNNAYIKAKEIFNILGNYNHTKDYLLLINCRNTPYAKYYDDLIKLIGFEDTKQIICNYNVYFENFINGKWLTSDKRYHFEIDASGKSSHNLPSDYNTSGYYSITRGIYYNGFSGGNKQLKFSIVDKNTVSVFCYKNNKNYKLIRQ